MNSDFLLSMRTPYQKINTVHGHVRQRYMTFCHWLSRIILIIILNSGINDSFENDVVHSENKLRYIRGIIFGSSLNCKFFLVFTEYNSAICPLVYHFEMKTSLVWTSFTPYYNHFHVCLLFWIFYYRTSE